MSGSLKPGDRLIEMKIAKEMATSQAPVREALRDLEAMGMIESHRNKGARVRVITNEELRQIYDVRAQLEGYATYLVAANAAPIEKKLRASILSMTKAAEKLDYRVFADHNMEFHRMIVKSSQNSVLLDLWETLNVKMRTMVNVSRSRGNLQELAQSHDVLVEAILTGNPELAFEAARDHVITNKPCSNHEEE